MHPLARPARSEPSETQHLSEDAPRADAASGYVPPRYGQAAAIYALYQHGSVKQRTKPPRPRKPGGGKLVRMLTEAAQLLRGLTPAEA